MPTPQLSPIDPELLQHHAAKVLDIIADYYRSLAQHPIKAELKPGALAESFPQQPPSSGKDLDLILSELESRIVSGLTHWQHPRFFCYYPASTSIPAILSELLIASFASVGLQWSANPIATELECVVMDWFAQMIHAGPESPFLHRSGHGGGIIQNTAGESLVAVYSAARVKKHLELRYGEGYWEGPSAAREEAFYADSSKFVVYMSDQSHFSAHKALRVVGLRPHLLPAKLLAHGNYGIDAAMVAKAIEEDLRRGLIPCAVQLNFGSTNTSGYDDLASFADLAQKAKLWLHVDAAYAGAALVLPQFKEQSLAMQQAATSFNVNGSKWLRCGFDSAFLYVRERRYLKELFQASDAYLDPSSREDIYNPEFKDWSVPLGRRFRALRIWMVFEYFGMEGIKAFLNEAIDQADWLRAKIRTSSAFELVVQSEFGLVCFRPKDQTLSVDALISFLKDGAAPFLVYPSLLMGRAFLRVALGGSNTTMADVEAFWQRCLAWEPAKGVG